MEFQRVQPAAPCGGGSFIRSPSGQSTAVRVLGTATFLLLAVVMCARALLDEARTIPPGDLLTQPQVRMSASLTVRYVCHLMAAAGVGSGVLWIILSRGRWRWSGLEAGAVVLSCGAMLAVPAASDKRLALNTAIDVILPLFAAAVLYHLLAHRSAWRRALLTAVVGIAAANCWKATAQHLWEYRRGWDAYQRNKTIFWSQRGVPLDDPAVAAWEKAHLAARPRGFIQGINALSSFLLLGLAGTGAALAAVGWRPRGPSSQGSLSVPAALKSVNLIVSAALVALILWQLFLLLWIQKTLGAIVGLSVGTVVVAAGLRMRDRPRRLAISLATGLVLLQTALIVLATSPAGFRKAMVEYEGPGRKISSLGVRLCIWQGAVRLFLANPLTGVGPSQFAKRYLAERPAGCNVAPVGSHNWLLNTAAEWGILGILGVMIAVGGSGWCAVRAIARPPPDEINRTVGEALPASLGIVLASWLMLACDMPPQWWANVLPYPVVVSLVAAVVSVCRSHGTAGQVILLAGLVGFLVHCTVDETSNIVGVMWPFWAMVALAMAWKGHAPEVSTARSSLQRVAGWSGLVLAGAAALVVVLLTVRPLRATAWIREAQRAAAGHKPDDAVRLLRAAAQVDPWDPLPLAAAGALLYRLEPTDAAGATAYLRDCVALAHAAVQRNPFDYESWRFLAIANMSWACTIEEFALVDEAIRDMRRALELNPQWPAGWLELARMAAATPGRQGERVELLRTALTATDKALALEEKNASEAAPSLTSQDRTELLQMREQLVQRLEAVRVRPTATQPTG